MKLSIVIPCYNEAENLPSLVAAYAEIISGDLIEVVLVNDGSTDASAAVLAKLAPEHGRFLRIINSPIRQGYGGAVLAGLRAATGEFIGWTHGDLQTPPRDVMRAFKILEEQNWPSDFYIKGARIGRPWFDRFFTWGMSVFETVLMGAWLFDINAQPNIFHRRFFETWKNPPVDFSLDLYALYFAKKQKLKIIRFSVPFLQRTHGESSWNTGWRAKFKFIKRTIVFSFNLKTSQQI